MQQWYFVRTSRFECISRLRAKVVLYVRNKSLTRTRRTSYAQVASSAQVVYVRNKSLMRKSRIFYAKLLTGRTSRTTYVRRLLQAISTNQQEFSEQIKILTLSFPFLYLSSLASWHAVNRARPHDSVVTGPRKRQASLHPSVLKT